MKRDELIMWLKKALQESRVSQSELARRLSKLLSKDYYPSTINNMLSGKRDIGLDEALAISRALNVVLPIDANGRRANQVPLAGYVGAGAQATMFMEGQGPFDMVDAPEGLTPPPDMVAVEVRGDSMYPQVENGWLIFYNNRREAPTEEMIGKLCVVGADDGQVFVKKMERGADGTFTLLSVNAPPILNVKVAWAARVAYIEPR